MRTVDVRQRGKRGKIIASRNRFGQYIKEWVPVEQPGTASQREAWGLMGELWQAWNELSDERLEAWWHLAEQVNTRPTLGQSGSLDGPFLFRKLNTVLLTCRRKMLLDPPPLPVFGPNPVVGFTIRERKVGRAMRLKVSRAVRWQDRQGLEDLMVFGWAPCRPGRLKNSHYAFLGLVPAPVKWECDFTELYLKKLEDWRRLKPASYHLPLEGSRIFIRVWQQVNGWENDVGMFLGHARVPGRGWPR